MDDRLFSRPKAKQVDIGSSPPIERIISTASIERIIAPKAIKFVITRPAGKFVVSVIAFNDLVRASQCQIFKKSLVPQGVGDG